MGHGVQRYERVNAAVVPEGCSLVSRFMPIGALQGACYRLHWVVRLSRLLGVRRLLHEPAGGALLCHPCVTVYCALLHSCERICDVQLASTEEYIDGQFTGNLGEVLIRCGRHMGGSVVAGAVLLSVLCDHADAA